MQRAVIKKQHLKQEEVSIWIWKHLWNIPYREMSLTQPSLSELRVFSFMLPPAVTSLLPFLAKLATWLQGWQCLKLSGLNYFWIDWKFAQMFMVPKGWSWLTLVIPRKSGKSWGLSKSSIQPVYEGPQVNFLQTSRESTRGADFARLHRFNYSQFSAIRKWRIFSNWRLKKTTNFANLLLY